eukprot:gene4075-7364_t
MFEDGFEGFEKEFAALELENQKTTKHDWKVKEREREKFVTEENQDPTQSILALKAREFLIRQEEAKEYLEEVLGVNIDTSGEMDLVDHLKSGKYMALFANTWLSDKDKIKKVHNGAPGSPMEFMMSTDNVNNFLDGTAKIDFPKIYYFVFSDLWHRKNPPAVVHCIHALAHYLERKGLSKIKIKDLSKHNLHFDQDKINKITKELEDLERDGVNFENFNFKLPNDQEPVEDDPFDDLKELDDLGVADPNECTIEGKGSKFTFAGKKGKFTIIGRNQSGKEIFNGGDDIQCELISSDGKVFPVNVVDLKNGKYECDYTLYKAGKYKLNVKLNGKKLKRAPDEIECKDAQSTAFCKIISELPKEFIEGKKYKIKVQAYDEYGNPRKEDNKGGNNLDPNFLPELRYSKDRQTPPMNVDSCNIKDMEDGTYEVDFTLPFRGPYQLRFITPDKKSWDGFQPIVLKASQGDLPKLEFEFMEFKPGDSVIQFKVKEDLLQQKKNRYVSMFLKNPSLDPLNTNQRDLIQKMMIDKWKGWVKEYLTNLMNTMDLENETWGDYEKRAQELLENFIKIPFQQKGQMTQFVSINDEPMDWTHFNQEKLKEFTKEPEVKKKPIKDLGSFKFDFIDPNEPTVHPRRFQADFWTWIRSLIVESKKKPAYKIDNDGQIRLYFDQHIVVKEYTDIDVLNVVRVRDLINFGKHQMSVAQRLIFEILRELEELPDFQLAKNTLFHSSKLIFAKMKRINDTFMNYSKKYGNPQDEINEKIEENYHQLILALKREYLILIKNMNEGFQDILKNELKLSKEQILDISLFSSFYKFDLNELQKGWQLVNGYELSSKDRKIHVYEFLFENQYGKLSNSYEILVPMNTYFDKSLYKNKLSLRTSSDRARPGLVCPFKIAYIKFNHVIFEAIRTGSLPGIDAEDSFLRKDIANDNAVELLTSLAANHAKRFSREELMSLKVPLKVPLTSVCLLTPFFFGKREDRQTFEQQQAIIETISQHRITKIKVDLHDFKEPVEIRIQFENPTFVNFGTNAIIKTLMMGSGYQRVVNARKWGTRAFCRKVIDFQQRLIQRNYEIRQQMSQYFLGAYFNTREGILYRENFTKLLNSLDNTMILMNDIIEKNKKKVSIQEAKLLNLQNKLEKRIVEDWLPSFDVITSVEFQYLSKIKGQVKAITAVEDAIYKIEQEHQKKLQEIVEVEYSLIQQLQQTFSAPEIVAPNCWVEYFELTLLQKDIFDLFTDMRELYHDREHEKFSQQVIESSEVKEIDSFSIPVRILLLGFHIGEQVHFNCKSGKDRTGMMAEHCCEFVELHAQYGEYPRVRAEKEKYNKHRQKIQQTLSMNGSTLDITQMNQGIPGSKIDQSMSGRFEEGWYKKYKGLSKLGKVKFATKDEWYKFMQ